MPLTNSDVHVNTPLSNVLISYFQNPQNFVARRAFPVVPVTKQSDRYYTIERGNFNRDVAALRAPGTEAAHVDYTVNNTPTYSCSVYAFKEQIPDQIRANADSVLNLDMIATQSVAHKLLIREEKLFASTFMSEGVWSYDYDGVNGGPSGSTNEVDLWNNDNSDPIRNIQNGQDSILERTGFKPNTLVMGQKVYSALKNHPDVVDRIKYGQQNSETAIANERTMAALFDVERVLVMRGIENTGKEGQTNVHSFISGRSALLVFSAPTPSLTVPSAGYTFSWRGYIGGTGVGEIRKYREDKIKSDWIEGETAIDQKLISADLGAYWHNVVAA
jgi:hypothetical protein